jgi:hypothetical protein
MGEGEEAMCADPLSWTLRELLAEPMRARHQTGRNVHTSQEQCAFASRGSEGIVKEGSRRAGKC